MMEGKRFTAWFSATERRALEVRAEDEGTTINYIVRRAVRAYLGNQALKDAHEDVTAVTGNN